MQRDKGKRGERELAKKLAEVTGHEFRRTQQYNGEGESDVISDDLPGIHWECKRCESLSLYKAMDQAASDCSGKVPAVCHRRNGKDWLLVVRLEDLMEFISCLEGE